MKIDALHTRRENRALRDCLGRKRQPGSIIRVDCWQVLLPGENLVIERSARQPATTEQPIVFVVDDGAPAKAEIDRILAATSSDTKPRMGQAFPSSSNTLI